MATPDSPKLEEKNSDDAGPISQALVVVSSLKNNEHDIINQAPTNDNACSKPEQNAVNEDSVSGNSAEDSVDGSNDDGVINQSPSNYEGSIASNDVPSGDNSRAEDSCIARNISAPDDYSTSEKDVAAENVIDEFVVVDGKDNEVVPSKTVQLFSCNQQPGNSGGFLKMEVHRGGLKVTTTGAKDDPHTLWYAHYTVDGELRQIVVFKNEQCSKMTNTLCVLHTEETGKGQESPDYILTGKALKKVMSIMPVILCACFEEDFNLLAYSNLLKLNSKRKRLSEHENFYSSMINENVIANTLKIKMIPERLSETEPSLAFFKLPKAAGSEMLFLKSLLSTEKKKLLVGFDGAGQPIPLNKVQEYSSDSQAFFKILEAE